MESKIFQLKSVEDCIALARSLNPKKEPLTIEKLKTFPGCEHYSDEEAAEILKSFDQLTSIIFEIMDREQTPCNPDPERKDLNDNS